MKKNTVMKKKKQKLKMYEWTKENDIRYRGPLSYRHLQVMGWIAISFKVLASVIALGIRIDPNQPDWIMALYHVAEFIESFALPLFLFANFSILLDRKKTYKQQLIKFGALSLLVIVLYLLITEHYILELGTAIIQDKAEVQRGITNFLFSVSQEGGLSFNLFIDMFLCTLLLFFVEYRPKHHFRGKKLYIFRSFALLPILYEAGSLAVRIMISYEMIHAPAFIYPFLTTKPVLSFVLFIILVLRIKFKEWRFIRHGRTLEDFQAFSQTNRHSLSFSIFASLMILLTGAIDLVLTLGFIIIRMGSLEQLVQYSSEALVESAEKASGAVIGWGIGQHMDMILIIPIILLFSYTRNHKNPKADLYIPAGGALMAVLVGIESFHQGLCMNIPILMNSLSELLTQYITLP